jgi:hypothetical protein
VHEGSYADLNTRELGRLQQLQILLGDCYASLDDAIEFLHRMRDQHGADATLEDVIQDKTAIHVREQIAERRRARLARLASQAQQALLVKFYEEVA